MKIALSYTSQMQGSAATWVFAASMLVFTPAATAEVPDWLRAAARESLPAYEKKTDAVILLDEQETRVKDNGEIGTVRRLAYKILRPQGRSHATFGVAFDSETKLTFLKAWSISGGREEEVKEKDAVETSFTQQTVYSDIRQKIITAPSSEPGSVVGYEYEQRERPTLLQHVWRIQQTEPLHRGRYLLQLPKGWRYSGVWLHYAGREPHATGENGWTWEVEDVPAIEREDSSPSWHALAGCLAVSYFPPEGSLERASWANVGRWYAGLTNGVRDPSPEIKAKVNELTAGQPTLVAKIGTLARFVQRDVRYVAIEMGVGGYQPHPAGAVLRNRYGDCKDKVTR